MKTCTGCKQTKAFTEFYKQGNGLKSRCKVCVNAQNKKHYQNNREKYRANNRKWIQKNPEKRRATVKKYYQNNREKELARVKKSQQRPEYKKKRRARDKERYRTDPQFKIANNLRHLIYSALRGNIKSASTITLLGCTVPRFLEHLEQQFQPGMTWENKGTWHLDHMMPIASFDLTDPEQQRQCCHYTNFQPLWGKENIIKKDKILYNREWNGRRWVNKT